MKTHTDTPKLHKHMWVHTLLNERVMELEGEKEGKKIRKYQLSFSDEAANRHQGVGGGECLCERVCVCVRRKRGSGCLSRATLSNFSCLPSVLYSHNLLRRLAVIKSLKLFRFVCCQFHTWKMV